MGLNDLSNDDCDIDRLPTLAELLHDSDLVITGKVNKLTVDDFSVSIDYVLKGSFAETIFKIHDHELDNGCYEEPLAKYLQGEEFVIIFLTQKEGVYRINDEWNLIKCENQNDYTKKNGEIRQILRTGENKRKRENSEKAATDLTNVELMEQRGFLAQGILTRKKAKRIQEIDMELIRKTTQQR